MIAYMDYYSVFEEVLSVNKKEMRIIMNSLAEARISDVQVLHLIKVLANNQNYKVKASYDDFCINCGIYYTGSMFAMMSASKRGLDTDVWSDNIMNIIYTWSE